MSLCFLCRYGPQLLTHASPRGEPAPRATVAIELHIPVTFRGWKPSSKGLPFGWIIICLSPNRFNGLGTVRIVLLLGEVISLQMRHLIARQFVIHQ